MIGSPERVKIQRSLLQNLSESQQCLKIIGCFLTFWNMSTKKAIKIKKTRSNFFKPIIRGSSFLDLKLKFLI